jgi:hypothetical protein
MAKSTVPMKKREITLSRSQLRVSRTRMTKPKMTATVVIHVEDGKIVLEPGGKRVKVDRNGSNQVAWTCPDGLFVVHFAKNGCPFDTVMFAAPKNKSIASGACNPATPLGPYHYAIWVWNDPAGPPLYLDPIVDVEDGSRTQGEGDDY